MSMMTLMYLLETYGPRLSMEQLGRALGLSAHTLHGRLVRGELDLPTYVDGKMRWADARDVAEYLDRMREQARRERSAA